MTSIRISFDRADRRYKFGDEVAGTIAVEVASAVMCSEVGITHGWRTHGRGFTDRGCQERRILPMRKKVLQARECRKFPFHFRVPNGPVTYHGHYLNVDWYVTAHVRLAQGRYFTHEQDFLLLGGDSESQIQLGDQTVELGKTPTPSPEELRRLTTWPEVSTDGRIPIWVTTSVKSILSAVLMTIFFALVLTGLYNRTHTSSTLACSLVGLATALLGAWWYFPKLLRRAYQSKLELTELQLTPEAVRRGRAARCRIALRTKAAVHLRDIRVSMIAQERVTRPTGTVSATHYLKVRERTFARRLSTTLPAGREVSFEFALPVAADAPVTFASKNNGLDWLVKVKVGLPGWPSLTETLAVTVLP